MAKKTLFTVLMADDDPDDRYLVMHAFKELGFPGELEFVEDGAELIQNLGRRAGEFDAHDRSRHPALILLDLNMPRMDGWKALEEIKNSPDFRNIPVAIWTTSSNNRDRSRCISMGADSFVTKPVSYRDLLKSLGGLVERYCLKVVNVG